MDELRVISKSSPTQPPTLRDVAAVLFRQRRLAWLTFLGLWACVILYYLLAPSYQAEMSIMVTRGRSDPVMTPVPTQGQFEREQVSEEDLNSEVELLHDQEILRTVALASGLDSPNWVSQILRENADERLAHAMRRLDNRLVVEPGRKSTLITVSYRSAEPAQAASVLRALEGAYLERHSRLHRPPGEFAFFERQVTQSRKNLENAEMRLMQFSQLEGVVSADQERDLVLQKLAETKAGEKENRVQIAETDRRVQTLRSKIQELPERATTLIRNSDNPLLLQKLKATLLDLQLKRTQLLTRFEPSYRLVVEVEKQIAETKDSIAKEELAPIREQTSDLEPNHAWAKGELVKGEVELAALQTRAWATKKQLADYQLEATALGDRAVKQDELLNTLKAAEQEYLLYMNKREEARIEDALDEQRILNVVIAEQPRVPTLPLRSTLGAGIVGLLFAGTVSTGLVFAADRLDPTFRTPDEVIAYLGCPVLASLPRQDG
jgi:uncharacterized protein involved in exopolysaccharide biosynthesis